MMYHQMAGNKNRVSEEGSSNFLKPNPQITKGKEYNQKTYQWSASLNPEVEDYVPPLTHSIKTQD